MTGISIQNLLELCISITRAFLSNGDELSRPGDCCRLCDASSRPLNIMELRKEEFLLQNLVLCSLVVENFETVSYAL